MAVQMVERRESLKEIGERLCKTLRMGATAATRVAIEVVALHGKCPIETFGNVRKRSPDASNR